MELLKEEDIIQKRNPIESFDNLKHGDLIINPIDNEVIVLKIDKNNGDRYLCDATSAYPSCQFSSKDFYFYDGTKEIGEKDNNFWRINLKIYFKNSRIWLFLLFFYTYINRNENVILWAKKGMKNGFKQLWEICNGKTAGTVK